MYKEFENIYSQRPFKDNIGGLNFYGMYSLWNILNKLKPKHVIESGVWKGCSTWMIDKIDSVEKIICIDPLIKVWYPDKLLYVSKKAEYVSIDFLEQNFENINLSDCVVFFDDHQDILSRLIHCKKLGINNIIMDDNYRTTVGSHISLYCLQNLVIEESFKEIEIEKEINYNNLEKNENIEDIFYKEMINNNLTYIKIII